MNREEFLRLRNQILLKIGNVRAEESSPKREKDLSDLYKQRDKLYKQFINENKPCEIGDCFQTESAGGRKIKGVTEGFFIRDGVVYVESYYPIVNGNKKSQIAYFSIPHKELKIVKS